MNQGTFSLATHSSPQLLLQLIYYLYTASHALLVYCMLYIAAHMLLLILRVIRDVRRKFPTRLRLEAGAQVKNKETDIPWRILQWPMESSDSPYVMINGIYSSLNRSRSPDLVDCNPGREAVTRLEREARLTDWYFMQSCTSPVWASPIYRGGQKYDHHRSNNTLTSRVSKAQIHQIWSLAYHLQLSSREWKASLNICSIAGQNNLVFAWKKKSS